MTPLNARLAPWAPYAQAILRIVTGYLFLWHGSAKLLHVPYQEHFANLPIFSLMGFAGIMELVGGALLLVGAATRPVAFILCGEMAFAYFMGHASHGSLLLPIVNKGEDAVLFCFIFLFLCIAGPGPWSIDAALGGRRRAVRGHGASFTRQPSP
jgi:putative oxidoreductase